MPALVFEIHRVQTSEPAQLNALLNSNPTVDRPWCEARCRVSYVAFSMRKISLLVERYASKMSTKVLVLRVLFGSRTLSAFMPVEHT